MEDKPPTQKMGIMGTLRWFTQSDLLYKIIIFILPLAGLIASNVYISPSSQSWYTNIQFILPDISNNSYGMYISFYIYLVVGAALVLIYASGETMEFRKNKVESYSYFLIPLLFLLIYISNPIMLQSQSLLAPAIIYVFVTISALIILYYTFKINNMAKWLWLIFVIWIIYLTIFYFSGGINQSYKVTTIYSPEINQGCNDNTVIA
ncbi:tryptophan-rich sensory protein [Alphaentomopoxvirus acuprea]|uniref:Tryptophan-rich sensory protein n=1 Tax=Alphaentomopoxvirus acuprea TaxID=62099 RepID=W6JIU0_9POXV|nr:tryptophan-rich sensory protein [Anomala cuprea entomopoxvirus]BAO49462.1 tryptophan-rich sensory protein [Anomala cuprea entomopoxvirus]